MQKMQSVRYAIILAVIGVIIALMVVYVTQSTQHAYQQNLPYITLGDNLKNKGAKARLLYEKCMAGDSRINFDQDVIALLFNSRDGLQQVYDGKQTEQGNFTLNDEETKAILKKAIIAVENVSGSMQQRWDFKKQRASMVLDSGAVDTSASTEAKLDQELETAYQELQVATDQLIGYVNTKVEKDTATMGILNWIVVFLIGVIFIVVSLGVFRMLRKKEKQADESDQKLKEESQRVEKLSSFIEAVSAGNYAIDIDSTDELSNKLIGMRDTLRNNAEEDSRRNWATSGLAQIGEILRSSDNTRELYDNIIRFVVKYVKSNQGGLFLLNDDQENDHYLELVACYAFERKKFIEKRLDLGKGLVGQCFMEGARIHLKKIPDGYVHITSGLGGTNPTSLLLIPMKVNDKSYGVLELASFQQYDEHVITLVEKFAESIASAVSSVKINESTRILLEKTQQQAEEMRSQEEEMRQNMEELSATQEEMLRKEREYINRIQELEEGAATIART